MWTVAYINYRRSCRTFVPNLCKLTKLRLLFSSLFVGLFYLSEHLPAAFNSENIISKEQYFFHCMLCCNLHIQSSTQHLLHNRFIASSHPSFVCYLSNRRMLAFYSLH